MTLDATLKRVTNSSGLPIMPRRRYIRRVVSLVAYLILLGSSLIIYVLHLRYRHVKDYDQDVELKRTAASSDDLNPPPGDMGAAVTIDTTNETQALVQEGLRSLGYNQYASDLMSVRRRLPDIRARWCWQQENQGARTLPPTSIVIVFYDEAWSVLLRTVHSILDRTPRYLIQEILLVDDYSTAAHLKTRLDEYFERYPLVRILRAPKRLGLIAAKVYGAKASKAQIITFLDSHVECTVGWLEPLIQEVASNATTIAIPTIDLIDLHSMALDKDKSPLWVGAYQWDLNFGWWGRAAMHRSYPNPYVPFDTPAMAGGLFSIDRTFFERLGWYDEGFEMYGIENIELSMKSWMCGGRMVIVPCSRVAHIAKHTHPYLDHVGKDVILKNSLRLAEVWMDEYKQIMFDVYGIPRYLVGMFGSVAARKAVRQRAGCGTFRDYILNAFPEMMNPLVPGAFRGEVRNAALGRNHCLSHQWRSGKAPLSMERCNGRRREQYWTHNFYHELNSYSQCVEVDGGDVPVEMRRCHRKADLKRQRWQHVVATGQFKSESSGQCLAEDGGQIVMEPCDSGRRGQRWIVKLIEMDVSIFKYN
ncbi:putative polypeptide N-acetylgalactosaminyltransferase 9 [Anopheles aquasalis]|uniref:putative polypeptide N-acetylgalactosaminyltransferase 9 n=1 Tax=Anopheles aquasalis TaxID=42839 RepID=UPI00215A9BBC|nr:putative polypeptide N-acetylgalactosaminyltransferase 9 [Anopheles aquasalis]